MWEHLLPSPKHYLLEVGDLLHGHLLLFLDGVTHGLLHSLQQEGKGSGILVQMTDRDTDEMGKRSGTNQHTSGGTPQCPGPGQARPRMPSEEPTG